MRLYQIFFFILFTFFFSRAFAQNANEVKQPRILILLDESSSMVNEWTAGKPRYKAAKEIILNLMDSIYKVNDQVEFSLRAFGEQHPVPENNCYDTKNEVMFSKNNYTQMALRLDDLRPLGVTAIAYSLKEAAENDLIDEKNYSYSIILITDGGESCGGDICDVVRTLVSKKIFFKPYIVSLVDYAPLKSAYACLGEYMQVTNESQIPKTVGTIVEAYRPALTIAKTNIRTLPVSRPLEPVIVEAPKAEITKPKPEPVAITPKPQPAPTPKPIVKTEPKPVPPPKPIVKTEPEPVRKHVISTEDRPKPIAPIPFDLYIHTFPQQYYTYTLKKVHVPKFVPVPIEPETPAVVTKAAAKPPTPIIKPAVPKPPVIAKKPVKPTTTEQKQKEVPFEIHTEDSKETTVEVYFTNGSGKFYSTAPEVWLINPNSIQTVKKFYRTVDAAGNPQPQKDIQPGTYNLTVAGRTNLLMRNVVIEPNKVNIITVKVSTGSLTFHYAGNPNRPVSEFSALVIQRDLPNGKVTKQKCTEELQYEAGNYYVAVNTLPEMRRNLDIDFESEYDMAIEEPGYLQITNTSKIGKVALYCPRGDQYLQFFSLNVDGVPESQKVRLQPGLYQVHFAKDPNHPYTTETTVPFRITSNETTPIELTR